MKDDVKVDPSGHWARFKGTTWPLYDEDLEWRLRYVKPVATEDALRAASILNAYCALIEFPEIKRRVIVRNLRAALAMTPQAPESRSA